MSEYKILLDDPARQPKLGFDQYAQAFAGIIRESEPRFAIGVFGNWGSGKTTLMRAIERELAADPEVITLWFNAWRYEREEHLIVPMLDTLREALLGWSRDQHRPEQRAGARRAAATAARAARAILVGLSLRAGLPGAAELALDAGKIAAAWNEGPDDDAEEPQSFYHASFTALQQSLAQFAGPDRQRIVIFVDDLDRCLPASALQVLESMKLFFDLSGFVFVVGLDRHVVELAIETKYGTGHGAGGPAEAPIKGVDYIKKIFQVPFTLPPISRLQLDEFLDSIGPPQVSPAQDDDLRERVRPHLAHLVTDAGVNPREVKRYLNAYTLQRRTRPTLDADVVLCLQTLEFRADWKDAYDTLLSEREVFTDAVRRRLDGDAAAVENLWPELAAVPDAIFEYLGTPAGRRLLMVPSLDPYLHSVEATRSTQPGLMESYRALGNLRGLLRSFDAAGTAEQRWQLRSNLLKEAALLLGTVTEMSGGSASALLADVEELVRRSELPRITSDRTSDTELESWRRAAGELLARVHARLRRLRDSTGT